MSADITTLAVNTIRTLSMDAVQAANSGHPGTPMALAPVAYTLWQRHLNYDPADPLWPNRDRFVLSVGHASMLIYSMVHLTGIRKVLHHYEVTDEPSLTLDDLKKFRQLDSLTPGHPEYHWTSGIETTTGPLGQGYGNSVGMAIAAKRLAAMFNKPGYTVFDHHVFALGGDGCMMEGVSNEAASIAGHLRLGNLTWIYDSNHITIEGNTKLAFTEDVGKRFEGLGWHVLNVADANDIDAMDKALTEAKAVTDKPTLIIVTSTIAWGAPNKANTHGAHGEPLGDAEIALTKKAYGWPEDAKFLVPDGVKEHFAGGMGARGKKKRDEWNEMFSRYSKEYPDLAKMWAQMSQRNLPDGWDAGLPVYPADAKGKATRETSGEVLNVLAKNIPWLMGGAADLAPSTKTKLTFADAGVFSEASAGRNMHFGVREHAMGSVINGMALSKLRPYGSGFLIFLDYGKAPARLAAIMELPVLYVFTHDSIGVGEDGPTHQPIEQLMMLRAMPGFITIRPCDGNEVVEAYKVVMQLKHVPAALALSRQPLPTLDRTKYGAASGLAKGAYVLADAPGGKPDVILMGSGSEVGLCLEAHDELTAKGVKSRVVSFPSWEIFEHYCNDHPEYREEVFPSSVTARVSVEMSSVVGWGDYVGLKGKKIGMRSFGASAPFKALLGKFGFTKDKVVAAAMEAMKG